MRPTRWAASSWRHSSRPISKMSVRLWKTDIATSVGSKDPTRSDQGPWGPQPEQSDHGDMTAPTIPSARPQTDDDLSDFIDEARTSRHGRDGGLIIVCVIAGVALLASVIRIGFGMRAIDESKS